MSNALIDQESQQQTGPVEPVVSGDVVEGAAHIMVAAHFTVATNQGDQDSGEDLRHKSWNFFKILFTSGKLCQSRSSITFY